jgi:hypothetical protein
VVFLDTREDMLTAAMKRLPRTARPGRMHCSAFWINKLECFGACMTEIRIYLFIYSIYLFVLGRFFKGFAINIILLIIY